MKKIVKDILVMILALSSITALFYVLFLSQPGIEVSCSSKSILGFRGIPPPLMSIVQPETCRVELIATIGDSSICDGNFSVLNFDKGVFPCERLTDHLNETVKIEAIFFDLNNQLIGSDKKDLLYTGILK
jgi:hypothetical protein